MVSVMVERVVKTPYYREPKKTWVPSGFLSGDYRPPSRAQLVINHFFRKLRYPSRDSGQSIK